MAAKKNNFTDKVYKTTKEVLTKQEFASGWQKFMTDIMARELLAADGPAVAYAEAPEKLRTQIRVACYSANAGTAAGVVSAAVNGGITAAVAAASTASVTEAGDVILAAAKDGKPAAKWAARAATMKMLKHFYRYSKRGAQDVWIYSPPKSYTQWIYDELQGTESIVRSKLLKEDEVYTAGDKSVMCSALQIALRCSLMTETKLASAEPSTIAVVKRWFADGSTTDKQTGKDVKTLLAGFKKITAVCNSNKLIFPDDPGDRTSATKYNNLYGSVWPGGEGKFPVIYLAGAFKKAGTSGKLWLCAQTIIHEASHLKVKTADNRYDTAGLKPGPALSHASAMNNADSWGYFCIDLCGYLSDADRATVLK